MIIDQIILHNFKSHKDTTIDFGKITSLVGTNGGGKTNVIKALSMVCFNEDWPKQWIRDFETEAWVKVKFTNGNVIKRSISPEGQLVEIIYPDGSTKKLAGKRDAYSFVQEAGGFSKVVLDESWGEENINFVRTNSPPFLVDNKYASIQRKVSGIIGISEIEDAKIRLTKRYRKRKQELEGLKAGTPFSNAHLDLFKRTEQQTDELLNAFKKSYTNWQDLFNKFQEFDKRVTRIHILTSLITTLSGLKDVPEIIGNLREKQTNILKLQNLYNELQNHSISVDTKSFSQIGEELNILKGQVSNLNDTIEKYNEFVERSDLLCNKLNDCQNVETELRKISKELETHIIKKNKLLEELGVCPTCNKSYGK